MKNRVLYQGRKVTPTWYSRHVQGKRPGRRRVVCAPQPIMVTMYLPAPACVPEIGAETRMVNVADLVARFDCETLRDRYLIPPCTELPTFFLNHP